MAKMCNYLISCHNIFRPSLFRLLANRAQRDRNSVELRHARDRLDAWLKANQKSYSADGPMRVMAYNSPFVPRNRNYFEVEIPIRPLQPADVSQAGG